jgi:fumarate hydratase class II
MTARATRIEHNSFGPVTVPADKLWEAQTQRSLEHFSIGADFIPREMIPAYAIWGPAPGSYSAIFEDAPPRIARRRPSVEGTK